MAERRKDSKGRVLKDGESYRSDGYSGGGFYPSYGKGTHWPFYRSIDIAGYRNRLYR